MHFLQTTVYQLSTVLYNHTNISKYAAMDVLIKFYYYNQ